jgi:hypothetical protein
MKKKFILYFILLIFSLLPIQCFAQFAAEELAERAQWEEFLTSADIISYEQMWGSQAITNPFKITLQKDSTTRNALLKNIEGRLGGHWECWKFEIAAYLLDKYLELNMVPPTVQRDFQGKRSSCQLWVEYEMSLRNKMQNNVAMPTYKVFHWNRATYLQRAFDNLIANIDRHAGNILITKDWRMILIDHSRTFRTSKKFANELIYTDKHEGGAKEMKQLPRAFVEKIESLNYELIKEIVGDYLTDDEINALLARKELILKEIKRLTKKYGEDKVLY